MREENNNFFKHALSDFAYDVACGAQIRHLADLGYAVSQIVKELDVAVSYESVQKTVTEHLRKTGVLLLGKPGSENSVKTKFIREYDSYGRPSFRQVAEKGADAAVTSWQERIYQSSLTGEFFRFLNDKTTENGEDCSYISCDFGLEKQNMQQSLSVLEQQQRAYIEGILWQKSRMYHQLTPSIRVLMSRLYDCGCYEGECYFMRTREHVILPRRS